MWSFKFGHLFFLTKAKQKTNLKSDGIVPLLFQLFNFSIFSNLVTRFFAIFDRINRQFGDSKLAPFFFRTKSIHNKKSEKCWKLPVVFSTFSNFSPFLYSEGVHYLHFHHISVFLVSSPTRSGLSSSAWVSP